MRRSSTTLSRAARPRTFGRFARLTAIAMLTALIAGAPGLAQARPDTRAMSCEQARMLVHTSGAITLSTGANTYARFVDSQRYCLRMEIKEPAHVPTRDANACFVGFRCMPILMRKKTR